QDEGAVDVLMHTARPRETKPGQGLSLRVIGTRAEQPLRRAQREHRLAAGPCLQTPQAACEPLLDRREIGAERVLREYAVGAKRRQGLRQALRQVALPIAGQDELRFDLAGAPGGIGESGLEA